MNSIQRQWTWTITGQYLRALAGLRFPRVGASECDVMFNLVPDIACADSQVFWSSGCFTNMLDYGAEHIKLRQLDMPRNFFTGNNCVAEYGQFPENFLLGVSTPSSEIQFRRQMHSRTGEAITVAGNPPVKFASASFEAENETHRRPSFPLFLSRVFLNDFFSIGILPVTEGVIFGILYLGLLRLDFNPVISALTALLLSVASLILLCVAVKKLLVGKKWGTNHSSPFWSWRHFAYFFSQDCFFVWCREVLRFFAGTTVANSILRLLGCEIGQRTIIPQPLQCFDWNAVSFGNDCYIDGFLQLHTFENMRLKVMRTRIQDGCALNVGATVMGGAVIEQDTTILPLSLVLKEINLSTGTYEGSPAEPASRTETPAKMFDAEKIAPLPVDNTDWLKTAAIILVSIDHFGYFFLENDQWWAAFGRMAAPSFFFLMGYARTRTVPLPWIWLGIFLTLLDSANHDWGWEAPNILLSFALIRFARPYAESLLQRYSWTAFALLALGLLAVLPLAAVIVDYGAEGWLWALFGLSQRLYVDDRSSDNLKGIVQSSISSVSSTTNRWRLIRLLGCLVAVIIYVWQEQKEFKFAQIQYVTFIVGISILSLCLCLFLRGPSRYQPPEFIAGALRFLGRHTLAIYAIELAAFELIVQFWDELAP